MGFREADAVVATHAMTNAVTGRAVVAGGRGVILKQVGSQPATYRVRFGGADGSQRLVIIDDVTDHDIAPATAASAGTESDIPRDVYLWTDSSWRDNDEGIDLAGQARRSGGGGARIGKHWGRRVIGVDMVPERREMAARHGVEVVDPGGLESGADLADALRDMTSGRGPDAVIDAVGMEAHGSPVARAAQNLAGLLPDVAARKVFEKVGIDGLTALHAALDAVRRGGTVSVVGVYGGAVDPMPMMDMFDKQIQLRMGQANVRRWTDVLLPLVQDSSDPLGVLDLVNPHRAAGRGTGNVQGLPGEDGRLHQGRHQALTGDL